jgi:hypothetical protein
VMGPELPEYDPLEGLPSGQREICEGFYGSGETLTFGYQDGPAPEPIDAEAEIEALRLYPTMKRS